MVMVETSSRPARNGYEHGRNDPDPNIPTYKLDLVSNEQGILPGGTFVIEFCGSVYEWPFPEVSIELPKSQSTGDGEHSGEVVGGVKCPRRPLEGGMSHLAPHYLTCDDDLGATFHWITSFLDGHALYHISSGQHFGSQVWKGQNVARTFVAPQTEQTDRSPKCWGATWVCMDYISDGQKFGMAQWQDNLDAPQTKKLSRALLSAKMIHLAISARQAGPAEKGKCGKVHRRGCGL